MKQQTVSRRKVGRFTLFTFKNPEVLEYKNTTVLVKVHDSLMHVFRPSEGLTKLNLYAADYVKVDKKILKNFTSRWQPKVGQRFRECDLRFIRIVEVVRSRGNKIHIKTVKYVQGPCPSNNFCHVEEKPLKRVTVAKKDRFFRNTRGYEPLGGKCHECQIAAGGVVPKGGHTGITVSRGICSVCLDVFATLVPSSDYHWPQEGKSAIFD